MTLARYANRRDDNEQSIVDALEKCGCVVFRLDRPADLLVFLGARCWPMEIKRAKGKLTEQQIEDRKRLAPNAIPVVRTPEEALAVVFYRRSQ
jgi:radical SAM superfamily enzyme with C-terminal helix-hairpin-helix motif